MSSRPTENQGPPTNNPKFARSKYDAIVIGSGPNGLAAAITVAQAGRTVLVVEGQETIGGGTRTAELTLPGFRHDVCSAVHPLGIGSPFFSKLPLAEHGLEWVQPDAPLAHPLDDGTAVLIERSVSQTAAGMGRDASRYADLMGSLDSEWLVLQTFLLGKMRVALHPLTLARFGLEAIRSASSFARRTFQGQRARAAFAGIAAHSVLPLKNATSAGFGLVLGMAAHQVGWPFARGGSASIAAALASYLRSLGGEIVTGMSVHSVEQLPPSRVVLCDMTPRQLARISGLELSESYRQKMERFRYGPGVCKVDWALDAPIPWKAQACARAGTVHLGGTLEEIEASELAPWENRHSDNPFVLLAQPSLFDETRAPQGKHVAWGYCHVPNGSNVDMSEIIEKQIERFAPGFRSRILKRSVLLTANLELRNPNLIGGDIGGGSYKLDQFLLRPTWRLYKTPAKGFYLCSSSTPPGGGVHGLCGHIAARTALRGTRW
jgi:phytoene dehydrogenase-like protein